MDLILCHTTADFDTLGAAVGLTRLYPGSRIVLAGGVHPAVKDFLAFHRDEYALMERRSVPVAAVRSLTVVDTQQRSRLGKTAEWLDLPNVQVTVYDHHPDVESDIAAAAVHVVPLGAVTTLVVEQMQAQGIVPTAIEATVMALGIHVDTGSLTFDHATPRDAQALAWLMAQGATVQAIAEYVDPGLSPTLQQWFAIALEQLQTETLQGYTIGWVLLSLDGFTPGLSSLASRLMETVGLDALLLGAQYPRKGSERVDSVSIIGRSRITGTNLNDLFQPWGGGGHPRAASVNLHQQDPQTVLTQLVQALIAQLPPALTARDLMSSPVRTIRPDVAIAEAQRVLLRYGHSGLSVVDADGTLVGIISRRDIDIALHHGFSHAPVKGYMTTNLHTIAPETLLSDIEDLMVTYDIGRLPVLRGGQLVGIVTRTDVLRQWHQHHSRRTDANGRHAANGGKLPLDSLLPLLQQRLIPELWELLAIAAQAAEAQGWQLFLVGGAVRDVLLLALGEGESPADATLERRLIEDIDLVVDGFHRAADVGAGVELARSLQAHYPQARLEVHGKFQTAALLWHHDPVFQSLWVDIATARTEFYPYPAANPEVEASSIQQDLYRRDFTINALAVRLTPPRSGELLDFFGGVLDLQARRIRVLHANSFIEDPTRIYRAVRFATRLGCQIDAQTEGYIRHAIASGIYRQIHDRTNPSFRAPALQTRLKAELKYILQAPYWQAALHLLADLDALHCIHPSLTVDPNLWRELRRLERLLRGWATTPPPILNAATAAPLPPPWLLRLEVLLTHIHPDYRGEIAANFQLPADSSDRLGQLAASEAHLQHILTADPPLRPSQLVSLLRAIDPVSLVLLALRDHNPARPSLRRLIWRYLHDWSQIKVPLDGQDLKALGYRPGPQFKTMLAELTAATLDGAVRDRPSAIAFLTQRYPF